VLIAYRGAQMGDFVLSDGESDGAAAAATTALAASAATGLSPRFREELERHRKQPGLVLQPGAGPKIQAGGHWQTYGPALKMTVVGDGLVLDCAGCSRRTASPATAARRSPRATSSTAAT
jgi:hypothetical protein